VTKFYQAGISGGVSTELRSAAVKMVFVKEESEEDMSEQEDMSEPEPWRIKHEEQGGWCLLFIHFLTVMIGLH